MAGKVTDQLIEFIQARSEWGQQLYGQGMNPFDGRDTVTDALEEVLDLAQYLMKWKQERQEAARLMGEAQLFISEHSTIGDEGMSLFARLGKCADSFRRDTAERHTKRP